MGTSTLAPLRSAPWKKHWRACVRAAMWNWCRSSHRTSKRCGCVPCLGATCHASVPHPAPRWLLQAVHVYYAIMGADSMRGFKAGLEGEKFHTLCACSRLAVGFTPLPTVGSPPHVLRMRRHRTQTRSCMPLPGFRGYLCRSSRGYGHAPCAVPVDVGASVDCFPCAVPAGRQVLALLGETRIAAIAKRAGARPTHEHWDDVLNLQLYRVSTAGLSGAPPLL